MPNFLLLIIFLVGFAASLICYTDRMLVEEKDRLKYTNRWLVPSIFFCIWFFLGTFLPSHKTVFKEYGYETIIHNQAEGEIFQEVIISHTKFVNITKELGFLVPKDHRIVYHVTEVRQYPFGVVNCFYDLKDYWTIIEPRYPEAERSTE